MGWDVHAVKRSSVWEFFSAWQGYVEANTPKQSGKLSEDEKDRIWERMQELDATPPGQLSTQTYTLDGLRLVPAAIVTFEVL
ncbi:hypothetical protein VW35_02260 [Devosia soli]|uniref:Uncharacterized protein n=1 Tax=Devosia soli TaxID=361041 RepID=A0A0F5LFE7_9HYPH|nr:hypothetical protein [Devosia soli]KKB81015.1 hypothetical protein VW35_02260 [Devosia soli]